MLNKYNNGKTAWYQSSLLNCPHGFSTRVGGYSTAPLVDGLNLTVTQRKGEIRENVLKNLAIFAEAVGVNPGTVLSVPECNGTNIAYVTSRDAGKGYYNNVGLSYFLNGNVCYDGYIADEEGITIGMKTATAKTDARLPATPFQATRLALSPSSLVMTISWQLVGM